jgi:anaerobic magnesium-protoporphyrin IX monomethyl ester cyclase
VMKVCICTTPIRPYPTDFPPLGSMAIIQSLRKIEINAELYNIDYFRYSQKEIEVYFEKQQFDVVGVSAVVSTAYSYTKYLSKLIRRVSPNTLIVVGGNLGASAEILLNKCDVDFCVIGDGEFIIRDLILALKEKPLNYDLLHNTKGIAFLDEQQSFCFTGYGARPSKEEIEFPDFDILERDGSLDHFLPKIDLDNSGEYGGVKPGKRAAYMVAAKGCVARCTFCHRFEPGFRAIPIERLTEHLRHLISKYNVGYIAVSDENFGSDRKVAEELTKKFDELGLKWHAAGVRTRTVTRETLHHWKERGCVRVEYGIESGSPKMLEIMEKNLKLEENVRALKWTGEARIKTTIQLVIGMPGENDDTIFETITFLKEIAPYIKNWKSVAPSESISINYAQALPGTPLYECARQNGLIGSTIDDEEKYLIQISDIDAYSQSHFVNLTGLPLLKVFLWRGLIVSLLDEYHYRAQSGGKGLSFSQVVGFYFTLAKNKLRRFLRKESSRRIPDSGFFNISRGLKYSPLLLNPITRPIFYPLMMVMMLGSLKKPVLMVMHLIEYVYWKFDHNQSELANVTKSLRKIVTIVPSVAGQEARDQMVPLRKGR